MGMQFRKRRCPLVKVALLARLVAKPGKEEEVGIFDAFEDDAGRKAHLNGPIAAALMSKAAELLAEPPKIEQVDLLAAKLPK
jgi:quinol monooxygenase YgiN